MALWRLLKSLRKKKMNGNNTPETSATENVSTNALYCLSHVLVLTIHMSSVSLRPFMLTYRPYDFYCSVTCKIVLLTT